MSFGTSGREAATAALERGAGSASAGSATTSPQAAATAGSGPAADGGRRPGGDCVTEHCEAVGREILAVLDGLQIQWVLAPESVDMAARLRGYLDRLLRELSPR
ncbi:hypothetical protein [Streptomyces yangpuensis]|uniref:hypothetical protein n=1 Tax=Streptomyces yangpuensis TaxID=1648182 RepID=UPI0036696956